MRGSPIPDGNRRGLAFGETSARARDWALLAADLRGCLAGVGLRLVPVAAWPWLPSRRR
jgi:LysR family hydrogen peroxide-inducible transcriptional activator